MAVSKLPQKNVLKQRRRQGRKISVQKSLGIAQLQSALAFLHFYRGITLSCVCIP